MKINEIFLFVNALSISFGFSHTRTEWSTVPQLDPRQNPSEEVLMKDTRGKAIDHVLKSSVEKKLLKRDNLTTTENSSRGKRSSDLVSSSEIEEDFIIDLISEAKSESGGNQEEKTFAKKSTGYCPSNVILILIDGLDRTEQNLRMDLENRKIFPVQGVLQSCASNSLPFRLTRSAECDCEDQLKSNIASLLTWARLEKKMSTSTLYEMPPVYSSRLEVDTKGFANPRVRRVDEQLRESWQLNKAPNSRLAGSSASPNSVKEEQQQAEQLESREHEEIMWHVSDVLSRLREAFFRSLVGGGADSPFEPSFLSRSNSHELAAAAIEELASMSNEKGYVMLATTTPAEIPEVVELIRRYSSQQNTLTVVMSSCPRGNSGGVVYYARGLGVEQLAAAKPTDLDGLFEAVRVIVSASACHGPTGGEASRAVEIEDRPAIFGFAQPLLLLRAEPEAPLPPVRLARNYRAEHAPEIFDGLEETAEIKKLEDPKADTVKLTDKRSNGTHESGEIGVRMGDFSNSQETTSPTTIIYVTVLTISVTYTLKY